MLPSSVPKIRLVLKTKPTLKSKSTIGSTQDFHRDQFYTNGEIATTMLSNITDLC